MGQYDRLRLSLELKFVVKKFNELSKERKLEIFRLLTKEILSNKGRKEAGETLLNLLLDNLKEMGELKGSFGLWYVSLDEQSFTAEYFLKYFKGNLREQGGEILIDPPADPPTTP